MLNIWKYYTSANSKKKRQFSCFSYLCLLGVWAAVQLHYSSKEMLNFQSYLHPPRCSGTSHQAMVNIPMIMIYIAVIKKKDDIGCVDSQIHRPKHHNHTTWTCPYLIFIGLPPIHLKKLAKKRAKYRNLPEFWGIKSEIYHPQESVDPPKKRWFDCV